MKQGWIVLILGLAAVFAGLLILKRLGCQPIPAVITGHADPSQGVTETPDSVTFTDKTTHKAVKIKKPIEGHVTYQPDGTVKVQNIGPCFIPKIGMTYVLGSGFTWYAGARLFFVSDWGGELCGNDKRLFLGIDVRDPVFNLLTTSIGLSSPWTDLLRPSPYLGEAFTLRL